MRTRTLSIICLVVGCFVVGCASGAGDRGSPGAGSSRPAHVPRRAGAVIVTAAGDICTSNQESCAPTAGLIRTIQPDAALTLGDNQYGAGTLAEYLGSYDHEWGTFKGITFPVAGNHEWKTPDAQGYLDYFGRHRYWYSFSVGRWRIYALDGTCHADGGCGPSDPQYGWLEQNLSERTDHCILAYWHQPRFSSGTTHGSDPEVAPFWRLLYRAHADLILNGHEHNYERFAPQNPSGRATSVGIVQIVAGTGGNGDGSYPFGDPIANSRVRLNGLGVVKLSLRPHGWVERFLRPNGDVVDRASGSC